MKKCYAFAGVELELDIHDGLDPADEGHLAPFQTDRVEDPHRFRFELVEELPPPRGALLAVDGAFRIYQDAEGSARYVGSVKEDWEQAYLRVSHQGREHFVQIRRGKYIDRVTARMILNSFSAEHLIVESGGVILHSSFVDRGGRGILFTAPSGTGKSTQADLWASLRGAGIVNGDRSAVCLKGDTASACGIPFAGSSPYCENRTLPLMAIVYLKQAPATSIRRLRGREAFRRVWEGCSVNVWDRGDVDRASRTVMEMLAVVPVYELACTPDESAVIALEGVLTE